MYLLCMIKARIRWCTCRVENILTLGKLLSLWFCFLIHSILFLISQISYRTYKIISSYELARPIMGTIFLVSSEISIEHPSVGLASLAQLGSKLYLTILHRECYRTLRYVCRSWSKKRGRCKSWTLDSGLDHGLDRGLDGGLDFGPKLGPSFGLASINRLFRLARRCQSMVSLCLRASWKKRPQLL